VPSGHLMPTRSGPTWILDLLTLTKPRTVSGVAQQVDATVTVTVTVTVTGAAAGD
jgi:hypothetical protein